MIFYITRFLSVPVRLFLVFLALSLTNLAAQNADLATAQEYLQFGKSFYYSEDYEKSIENYSKAVVIAEQLNDAEIICIAYTMIGHAYLMEGKNQEAVNSYYRSLKIAEENKILEQEVKAKSGLIIVLKRMNQLGKALEISRQLLKSSDKEPFKNTENQVNIIASVNEVYLETEQYDSVLHFAEKGIAISKSLDYKEGLVDLQVKKGMIFYYKKKYEESFKYLLAAQDVLINHDIKNKFFPTVNINYFLASCFYEQKQYDKSIELLLKNIHALEENDFNKTPIIQSHLLLANCYAEKKDLEKALYWHNRYLKLHKTYQHDKDKTVNSIYEKEAQKLEEEIASLKNSQIVDERTKSYMRIGFIVLFLVLLVFVFRYFKKQKSNNVVFNDLMKQIDHLESYKQRLVSNKEINTGVIIDDNKINEVLKGLKKLEDQEFFLKPECNLTSMAKKVKTNVTYLSKIINSHKEKNVNDYINDLRIDYALRRLKNDKKLRSFSIKSIAREVGYKSDYSFAKHFKAKTGLYPSYYIKTIEKRETVS